MIQSFGKKVRIRVDDSRPSVIHLTLQINDLEFLCSYLPFPLPKEEADIPTLLSQNHFITAEEQSAFENQKSFCLIAQIGGGKTREGKRAICQSISRLCGVLLEVDGAIGVYYSIAELLLGKELYQKHTGILQRERENPDYFLRSFGF